MEKLLIKIGASSDYFGAFADNCEGIYGAGATAEAAKTDALKGLELFINSRPKEDLPKILQGHYAIEFCYDIQSFMNHYNKIFTNVALERITGINQKLLHHYASGLKKPRLAQRKKIESALHSLGRELIALEL